MDNILQKLAALEVPFLRLGREAGVHPAVRPWLPGGARAPGRGTAALRRLAAEVPVVSAALLACLLVLLRCGFGRGGGAGGARVRALAERHADPAADWCAPSPPALPPPTPSTPTPTPLAPLAQVGATCLGVGHPLLIDKQFDVCIVDEAGQILLPAVLAPLLK